jgi:ribA/ribD-fused uncharacterized protein
MKSIGKQTRTRPTKFMYPTSITTHDAYYFQGGGHVIAAYPPLSNFARADITIFASDLLAAVQKEMHTAVLVATLAEWKLPENLFFPSSEHVFHFLKSAWQTDVVTAHAILKTKSAHFAKQCGRKAGKANGLAWDESAWIAIRSSLMMIALRLKFQSSSTLMTHLLDTAELELVEASPWDKIWGVGLAARDPRILDKATWKGENLLGKCLMRVRAEIRTA